MIVSAFSAQNLNLFEISGNQRNRLLDVMTSKSMTSWMSCQKVQYLPICSSVNLLPNKGGGGRGRGSKAIWNFSKTNSFLAGYCFPYTTVSYASTSTSEWQHKWFKRLSPQRRLLIAWHFYICLLNISHQIGPTIFEKDMFLWCDRIVQCIIAVCALVMAPKSCLGFKSMQVQKKSQLQVQLEAAGMTFFDRQPFLNMTWWPVRLL